MQTLQTYFSIFFIFQLTYVHYLQVWFLIYEGTWQLGMVALGAKWKSQLYDFPPILLVDLGLEWNVI